MSVSENSFNRKQLVYFHGFYDDVFKWEDFTQITFELIPWTKSLINSTVLFICLLICGRK